MGTMVIEGIWFFIVGRVLYGAASAIFFAAGGRYIEECSPPKYVSTLVVCYSCGIAFSRAVVLLGLTFIPKVPTAEEMMDPAVIQELAQTQTWRWFILLPAIFSVYCFIITQFVIRFNTPMFLINHKRDDEAKQAIRKMFNVAHTNEDDIFAYMSRNTAASTDNLSYYDACFNPRYRKVLLVLITIAVSIQINGMYTIGS